METDNETVYSYDGFNTSDYGTDIEDEDDTNNETITQNIFIKLKHDSYGELYGFVHQSFDILNNIENFMCDYNIGDMVYYKHGKYIYTFQDNINYINVYRIDHTNTDGNSLLRRKEKINVESVIITPNNNRLGSLLTLPLPQGCCMMCINPEFFELQTGDVLRYIKYELEPNFCYMCNKFCVDINTTRLEKNHDFLGYFSYNLIDNNLNNQYGIYRIDLQYHEKTHLHKKTTNRVLTDIFESILNVDCVINIGEYLV